MKPMNFPARKAARQIEAAARNLPRIIANPGKYSLDEHGALMDTDLINIDHARTVRSKKRRI